MEAQSGVALTTEYDPIFRRYAGRIPVPYLRALAYSESRMNPGAMAGSSSNAARGLLQVVGALRADYNAKMGTAYTADDLLNPEVSVKIATYLLNQIRSAFAKHPSTNLHEDWSNPEYVRLVTAGWNAGFSEGGGVGKVASYLEARGMPVTHASVVANAGAAGAVSYLGDAGRAAWHRGVADLYFAQPDYSGGSGKWIVLVVLGYAAYRLSS